MLKAAHHSRLDVFGRKIEDIVGVSFVTQITGFYLERELFHERTRVSRFGVRIGIPRFFLKEMKMFYRSTSMILILKAGWLDG